MQKLRYVMFAFVVAATACGGSEPPAQPASEAPAAAPAPAPAAPARRVFFVEPQDGATVKSPVKARFGLEGYELAPVPKETITPEQVRAGMGHEQPQGLAREAEGAAGVQEGDGVLENARRGLMLLCHPGRAQREPGPMPSRRNADRSYGSRVAPLRGLPGMTVREDALVARSTTMTNKRTRRQIEKERQDG
jgi:hypothetical protein